MHEPLYKYYLGNMPFELIYLLIQDYMNWSK